DASMVSKGLEGLALKDLDLVILENVGNLVCPAEFDTGAHKNVMILSVPEGDDKPLKYPLMFSICDVLIVNKIDCMELFDFNLEKMRERVLTLNPDIKIIPVSCKTGNGIKDWLDWLRLAVLGA
ncbi:MAG: hydrogenase nickel incorporation protein HypB, partial [Deltaproteobacteria bacterium]|nr:hydrogenase nickel incorporation protein HypB [Deltaproteobacteria bacterium]